MFNGDSGYWSCEIFKEMISCLLIKQIVLVRVSLEQNGRKVTD